jgi:hypothetical protein
MEAGPASEALTSVYIKLHPNDEKGYCICAGLHSITPHYKITLVTTAMKTSNLTHNYTAF